LGFRSFSQIEYVVLRDDGVLSRYKEQRATFNDAVSTLMSLNLSSDILDWLLGLQAREREVFAMLRKETPAGEVDPKKPVQLPIFAELARPLPIEISHTVARRVEDI
jgi:hypothetical protein